MREALGKRVSQALLPQRNRYHSPQDSDMKGAGPVAEWLGSRAPLQEAQCFVGSNPGRGHGIVRQTTVRQRPTMPQLEGPTTKNIQLCRAFGRSIALPTP